MSPDSPLHRSHSGGNWPALGLILALSLAGCSDGSDNSAATTQPAAQDRAFYVLPPGNFGGLPTTQNSLDQLPLYDGLTPLRGEVTDADIEQLFLREDFQPVGETMEEPTGRAGTTILYDEFGVPHITGETREDLAFGAGWVTARDRALLLDLGRGPARAAVADIPGIDAFSLVTSGQSFVPSAAAEQLVTDQIDLLIEVHGDEGRQILADAQAYVDGVNAFREFNGGNPEPFVVNDVVAVTAFIGSIFGAGGGSEVGNAEFLSQLLSGLGDGPGQQAWEDVMLFDDAEAPTTIDTRFEYGPLTGGAVTGSVLIDPGSVISLDPRDGSFVVASTATPAATSKATPAVASAATPAATSKATPAVASAATSKVISKATPAASDGVFVPAAGAPPDRQASNFLIVDAPQSVNDTQLAVMGPQLGFFYPEIVQQIHLSGAGIEAQGAAVPGLAMYILIGRTENYAWSLTSANHDVRDVYAEMLCNPDGSAPTRESLHYLFEGECIPFEIFDAGTLNGMPIVYPVSVHGPVIGTATTGGQPIALSRKRSTFGRDVLNLAALKDMTEGEATTPEAFWEVSNQFGFTFNWGYVSRSDLAFFSSGQLPVRPPGLDRRLPTLGTGEFEWQGFLTLEEHPHAAQGPGGRLLNWNNQSAPGFMHGDGTPFGSVHRVELFDQFPAQVDLAGVVGVMNRAATEDVRSPAWPVISEVLRGGEAPTELAAAVVDLLDDWVAEDAPRLDADEDGFNDHAGPTLLNALSQPLAEAVMRPVFGALTEVLDDHRNLGGVEGASFMDKDLRTLLGKEVQGPFNLSYCGNGSLEACRESLWQVVDDVAQALAVERGDDPTTWLDEGARAGFVPGLIPNTFRFTNRPTFQQVLEFAPTASGSGQ